MRRSAVRQDRARLLRQRRPHRHHGCDTARALCTRSSTTARAPQHAWTERARCRVVRRCDAVDRPAGPQRLAPRHHRLAGPFGLGHPTRTPRFSAPRHLAAQGRHRGAHRRGLHRPLAPPRPPGQPRGRLRQQGVAPRRAAPAPPSYRFHLPPPMRPAPLTPPHRGPVVGTGAVGDPPAGTALPPQRTRHLPTASQAPHQHGHTARHRPPSPRPCVALPPAARVEVGHRVRGNARAGCLSGWGAPLGRGRRRLADRPHTPRPPAHVIPHLARHARGHTRRPRAAGPRGPSGPLGTPAGQGARVGSPHAGHTR
jgi:hypothetical protein